MTMATRLAVFTVLVAACLLLAPAALLVVGGLPSLGAAWATALHGPLATSLGVSAAATGAVAVVGTPLAWAMARGPAGLRGPLSAVLLVPLLMPPLAIGLVLMSVFGPATPFGSWLASTGIGAANTPNALFWAEFYEAAPYFAVTAAAAWAGVDRLDEEAYALLGHSPWQVGLHVTLPQAAAGLSAALALAWARAIGAFGAAIVVAYHPSGLTVATWIALEEIGLPLALSLALVLVAVALPLPVAVLGIARRAPGVA
jgi:molybdate/tungstate transport system permease protein